MPGPISRLRDREKAWRNSYGAEDAPAWKQRLHYELMDHAILRRVWTNFAPVSEGVYRSNHPNHHRLKKAKDMGIKVILNLRGNGSSPHQRMERKSCEELGLTFETFALTARRAPPKEEMIKLIEAFRRVERPFLMHCKSGADRVGLASAMYLMVINGVPLKEARKQLSLKFLHVESSKTGILDHILDLYAPFEDRMGFEQWLTDHYDPEAAEISFQAKRGRVMSLINWVWKRYLTRYRGLLAVAFTFMVIEGSMLGILSLAMQPLFDNFADGGSRGALFSLGLFILGVFIFRALASIGQKVMLARVKERSAADISMDLLSHLMTLDADFHQKHPPGVLIERVHGDVSAIGTLWNSIVTGFGRDLVSVIWLFGVALWIDTQWTLVALIGIPMLVLPSLLVQGYVRGQAARERDVSARLSTRLDEVFHGIEAVKLNSLEPYQSARYGQLTKDRVKATVRTVTGRAIIPGLIDIMTGLGFLGVLVFGGGAILSGDKSVGQFMAFFTAMALAFDPLRRLANLSGAWQVIAASIERVKALFELEPSLKAPTQPSALPQGAPEVAFEDVHLSYADLPVLQGITFTAQAGQTTALVGGSGAGKSTLFKVLTRLIEPASGAVKLGGKNIQDFDPVGLRGLISTVAQEPALFDETLAENIALGRTVPAEELRTAVEAAHVSDFLPQMSEDLNTPVGPRGSALSGGQRQRVAIARALLRDTPVLLLDEATSALDTKSERMVQDALEHLSKGRTTLVIAHRLSTIRGADKIVVLDHGRVVDEGTHDELLARGGLYADLYALQFSEAADE